MSLQTGQKLGPYVILSSLGAGGMGEVYLAEDARLSRQVAVKVLPEQLLRNEARRRRFLREARAAASVDHPNVVHVYDVGELPDGLIYLVMQHVEGKSVRKLLAEGGIERDRGIGDSKCVPAWAPSTAKVAHIAYYDNFLSDRGHLPPLWENTVHSLHGIANPARLTANRICWKIPAMIRDKTQLDSFASAPLPMPLEKGFRWCAAPMVRIALGRQSRAKSRVPLRQSSLPDACPSSAPRPARRRSPATLRNRLRSCFGFFLVAFAGIHPVLAVKCPPARARPGCSASETLHARASNPDIISLLKAMEAEIRGSFQIPSPHGWPTTGGGRADITKHRPTDHDDNPGTPDRVDDVLAAVDIARHLRNDELLAALIDAQSQAIDLAGGRDPALALSIAYREGSGALFSTSRRPIDSQRNGGLDNFGGELPRMRRNAVCGLGADWASAGEQTNESGPSHPALIPSNEQLPAYDARLESIRRQFLETLRRHGFDMSGISERAERVAVAVGFANNTTGLVYDHAHFRDNPPAEGFSMETLVSWIASRYARGEMSSFNDLVTDPALRRIHRVRAAIAAAAVAEMLDRSLFAVNGGVPCNGESGRCINTGEHDECVVGSWVVDQEFMEEQMRRILGRRATVTQLQFKDDEKVTYFADGRAAGTLFGAAASYDLQDQDTVISGSVGIEGEGRKEAAKWSTEADSVLHVCCPGCSGMPTVIKDLKISTSLGVARDQGPTDLPPVTGVEVSFPYNCRGDELELDLPGGFMKKRYRRVRE